MKRAFYLFLTSVLGLLVSFIVHALIEIMDLTWVVHNNHDFTWHYYLGGHFPCALPPVLFYGLPVLGIVGGLLIGRVWWRWVYVEGRHWRRRKQ